ncbi:Exocyst complex component Exo70 [Sesbania bispinosa]|nr:Exocyst complex component Exo70 [Sesbania bispinosa]
MFAGVGLPNAKIQFTEGGNTSEILDVDVDRWSFFEARDIVKELGFKSDFNLWWNLDGVGSLVHLRPLSEDEHASELSYSTIQNKGVAHVFVDHVGAVIDGVGSVSNQVTDNGTSDVGVGTGTNGVEPIGDEFVDGEDDGNNSDDSVKGIHFTDSEEDRTFGLDDGFGIEDGSQVGRRLTREGRAKIQIRRNPFHGAGPSGSNGQENMVPTLIQILRWLMQPLVWRFVGFGSAVAGLLCYALSSSFNHLFGNWNLLKIFLYSVFSFIISFMVLFAKIWKHSRSLRFKANWAFMVLTITSVYSFFSDKVMNGKPDAYSLISCAAFAIMSLSLSRQTQCGFEVDLLYFFLGCLIVQLMKIRLELVIVGAGFSYSLIILRSYFSLIDAAAALQNEYVGLQDEHSVVIEIHSPQLPIIASMMQQLTSCVKALQLENSNLIDMFLEQVKKYFEGNSELAVTDHNFIIDALPSGRIIDLHETAKLMVGAGFEKEFSEAYSSWRRGWLEECLINKLLGLEEINIKKIMTGGWIRASKVTLKILFPGERRLCDHVFLGFSSAADRCFTEVCRGATIHLLNFADAVASGSPSVRRLFQMLGVFQTLHDLIPQFQSLFPDSLVNEAIAVYNRLGEASRDVFMELDNLIFRIPEAKLIAPADGGYHPMMYNFISHLISACRSRQILEQILQDYPKDANEVGTSSIFTAKMKKIMELLERELEAKSKVYSVPALRYIFIMNNRKRIEMMDEIFQLRTITGNDC